MSNNKTTDAKKLAAFFRSQGVPLTRREAILDTLGDAARKAIVAAVSDAGVVSPPAVAAYQQALDAHRIRVREAAAKPVAPVELPTIAPAPEDNPE